MNKKTHHLGGNHIKETILIFAVLVSMALAANCVQAQSQDIDALAGKKWTGTDIFTRPNRAVVKTTLEITRVTDGQIEGVFQQEVNGKPFVIKFKSPLDKNDAGLRTFKFKSDSGREYQCDMSPDGKLMVKRSLMPGDDPYLTYPPYVLSPMS